MYVEESPEVESFSLVRGGPFYRLMCRVGLVNPDTQRYVGEVWFLGFLTWFPLVILSALEGGVLSSRVRIPLLYDYSATVRFLIALPLLVAVEPVISRWVNSTVRQFVLQDIISQQDMPSFRLAVDKAGKMRDSLLAEIILVIIAYTGAYLALTGWLVSPVPTWQASVSPAGRHPSMAGLWYALISLPLWQFLMYRWVWRLIIWYVLLRKISRLDLKLVSTHPDLACGLGFLKYSQVSFSLVAFAVSSVAVAILANRIAYLEQAISDAYLPMTGVVLISLVVLLAPLFLFTRKLILTKRDGTYSYSVLAQDYTHQFDTKWVRHQTSQDEELLGTSDIQSLADLANSFNIIRNTKIVPFDLNTIMSIIVMSLIPLIPLIVGVLPLQEIVESVLRVLV